MPTANEIRQQFLDFFAKKHGHTAVPSSPVVPLDDPTLLFTNAGMNQFKDVFLGTGSRPFTRAVDTQKCIRAGGKHNDLDDVGKDTYHHTFFEMLGNWSFGDYFKKEAITWAWELLTEVWKLDRSRLHVTVFEGDPANNVPRDDEAAGYWMSLCGVPKEHLHYGNKKDNFWEMGETGPCGPCTEIHYDRTPDRSGRSLVNTGSPDVIEIWNLVFIQFNRNADRSLTPLPAKHVDTGMGFERITAVIQGKSSNYDTDVFSPIMDAIGSLTGKKYSGKLEDPIDIGFRVIADHLRMATFAITDGARPGNKKRDAVLRSVIRRAVRFGYLYFERNEPFLWQLVSVLVEQFGMAFPELLTRKGQVESILREEEEDFFKSLERGLCQFAEATRRSIAESFPLEDGEIVFRSTTVRDSPFRGNFGAQGEVVPLPNQRTPLAHRIVLDNHSTGHIRNLDFADTPAEIREFMRKNEIKNATISASDAFDLHATYGFPIDLTSQMAEERNLRVDLDGFRQLMREHEEKSKSGEKKPIVSAIQGDLPATDDSPKYDGLAGKAKILAWVKDNLVGASGDLGPGDQVAIVLDKTNFYAEQGGQVGDSGFIRTKTGTFQVDDTQRLGDSVLHVGKVHEGTIQIGQPATLEVSAARLDTMRNHTATHLMNWALRKVLGEHVEQKGSAVDSKKTRFDFVHDAALTTEQIGEVERLVNTQIYGDLPVTATEQPLAEAKKIRGVRAVFGEKYPDPVRVLLIGATKPAEATLDTSVEFCGGTHLAHTGQAGFFKIVGQELVAKGVRRVTAVTGPEAVATVQRQSALLDELAGRFQCKADEIGTRIQSLQDEVKKLSQQLKKGAATDLAGAGDKLLAAATKVGEVTVLVGELPAAPDEQIRNQIDRLKQKAGSAVVLVGWKDDGKVGLIAAVTDDLTAKVKAGDLVKKVAPLVGGSGGGRPNLAQAGGKNPEKLGDALAEGRRLVGEMLAK